ncbi:HAD-IIB family hydrolase [Zavarzinia sp.]|uniref:HAD-IIB family hydrolase n=1 Tax=Zavarzinia sp. TaxID=2027920 RepID=UPI0035634F70
MVLPLGAFPAAARAKVDFVLTDVDDTLTLHGRLPAIAYAAMERLTAAGIAVVPITGRSAGWCDLMARLWPVAGVIGEGGAFYFTLDAAAGKIRRRYWKQDAAERAADRAKLALLAEEIPRLVPGSAVAADQFCREVDLAIDFREDVAPLPWEAVDRIVALFEAAGATAKYSTAHVNGWFGAFDKLAMTRVFFAEHFGLDLDAAADRIAYIGDSPNDVPMFGRFPNAVGVANIDFFGDRLTVKPAYVTRAEGGEGFAELAEALLAARR